MNFEAKSHFPLVGVSQIEAKEQLSPHGCSPDHANIEALKLALYQG
jgi:hypothetical protein